MEIKECTRRTPLLLHNVKAKLIFKMYIYFQLQAKDKFTHFLRFLVLRLDLSPEYRVVALVQPTFFCSLKILHVQFQHKTSCFASLVLPIPIKNIKYICLIFAIPETTGSGGDSEFFNQHNAM